MGFLSLTLGLASLNALGATTLQQAVPLAMEHSPLIAIELERKIIREKEWENAKGKLLPQLDLKSTHGVGGERPLINSSEPWVSRLQISLTENLYDNGASFTQAKLASRRKEIAELSLERLRNQVILEVATKFYDYSEKVVGLSAIEEQKQILDKQFTLLSDQYRQGLKQKRDFIRLKNEVQRMGVEILKSKNAIQENEIELRRIIGMPGLEPLTPATISQEAILPKQSATILTHFDYRLSQLELDLKPLEISLVERRRWPQVGASVGAWYENQNYLGSGRPFGSGESKGWNALLTLQYNLWDWGIQRRDVEIAESQRTIQEYELKRMRLYAESQVQKNWIELVNLKNGFDLSQQLLKDNLTSFDLLESEYREGKASYLEYVQSVEAMIMARLSFYKNYFAWKRAMAEFAYFSGELYDKAQSNFL